MGVISLLRSLKYAGADDLPEYDIKRGVCIGVNLMCISIFLLNTVTGVLFFLLSGKLTIPAGAFGEALLMLGIVRLNEQKKYEAANACFYTIINLATCYFGAVLGKTAQIQLMILFILGLTFFVFRNAMTRRVCVALTLLLLILLEANYYYNWIPPTTVQPGVGYLIRWVSYVVIICLVLLIFYLYNKNTEHSIQVRTYSRSVKADLLSEEKMNELKNLLFQHISHDIRGAYFGVSGICAVISQKVSAGEPVTEQLADHLVDASENYKFMLNNFLELSKFKNATIDNIHLEPVNIRTELDKIVSMNEYIANQKEVTIQALFSGGFPELIIGDRLKITRIILNLLSNALKFTRPGTTVQLIVEQKYEFWKLTVKDEGKGIPSDLLKKIFDPFVTEKTPQNPEGVGLGLYITKYLTEILGAKLHVISQLGAGTSFEVTFPLETQLAE